MTSRLDRLFVLLETGSSAVTRRAAAKQLGEVQKLYPHELHCLLSRVEEYLRNTSWDTRIAAAQAVEAILLNVPPWDPPSSESTEENAVASPQPGRLTFQTFDLNKILTDGAYLMGSVGSEYDLEEDSLNTNKKDLLTQQREILNSRLGLNIPELKSDLLTAEDLIIGSENKSDGVVKKNVSEILQNEMSVSSPVSWDYLETNSTISNSSEDNRTSSSIQQSSNSMLSSREMNRARRKARQLVSKQRSLPPTPTISEDKDNPFDRQLSFTQSTTFSLSTIDSCDSGIGDEPVAKKFKSTPSEDLAYECPVPDATGSWCKAIDWPLEGFVDRLCQGLFHPSWEVRHGSATALRETIRIHGKGAGKSIDMSEKLLEESHQLFLEDVALRLLCVLSLDRFGDFVSDQVVAPVRETCAQALGSVLHLMIVPRVDQVLKVLLQLLKQKDWETRHGGLLGLKYLLAVRKDLVKSTLATALTPIISGLSDPVEDVGAVAASALIPVSDTLVSDLSQYVEPIVMKLWDLLLNQDELGAACNSFMGLLASILSMPSSQNYLKNETLVEVIPRLWPFLSHNSSSVRKATLQTFHTLSYSSECLSYWNPELTQESLRHIFQRCLVEHLPQIQEIILKVWDNLVNLSKLEVLLVAACPYLSTWLCLSVQPPKIPFDASLLITANKFTSKDLKNRRSPASNVLADTNCSPSELKLFIGGAEIIPANIRESNSMKARFLAAKMIGGLSVHIVKPAPGVTYSDESESPINCFVKVLLAYLNSKSALQRTVTGLIIAEWARLSAPSPCPPLLQQWLHQSLNESLYFDEIASSYTKLLQEARDLIAMMKHYKLPLDDSHYGKVLTLDQIQQLSSSMMQDLIKSSKLKKQITETLEERRRSVGLNAMQIASEQSKNLVTTHAALAGAVLMLKCLPEKLNPVIKPLMESIKKEENEHLQHLAASHLSELIDLCVERQPCPNVKIVNNLCAFLCSDPEFTPRIFDDNQGSNKVQRHSSSDSVSNNCEKDAVSASSADQNYSGIITLINRQKIAEKTALKSSGSGLNGGPGRPPKSDVPLNQILGVDDEIQKQNQIQRRGAIYALNAIVSHFGADLPMKLPHLWETMVLQVKEAVDLNNFGSSSLVTSTSKAEALLCCLQVLEVTSSALHSSLLPQILTLLPHLCLLLTHPFSAIRHLASRCLAALSRIDPAAVMKCIIESVLPFLGASDSDSKREGAIEAVACILERMQFDIIPYIVFLVVPLLGRMSDQLESVRLMATDCFATLIQLMPLDGATINPTSFTKELIAQKEQERLFLEHLFNPKTIPNYQVPIKINCQLRSYQQSGINWLAFLNTYKLHGILCDDMGLGKTLQSIYILAGDHYKRSQEFKLTKSADCAPLSSLVICPPTLTGHWVYEVDKFLSRKYLNPLQYAGPPQERERLRSLVSSHNLIVASYEIVRKDVDFFSSIKWNYCILDEGHIIKNGKTKSSKAIKQLRANHRLILSGTPIQNNVLELWSLFDFLMPGFLGTEKQFNARYSRPILASRDPKSSAKEQEAGVLAMEALHRQVLPFVLRRMKEDVLTDLPPKITQDYYCDLSPLQMQLYEDFSRSQAHQSLTDHIDSKSGSNIFQALRYLQNVCNHPKLVVTPEHPEFERITAHLKEENSSLSDIQHAAKLPALQQLLLDCGIGVGSNNDTPVINQHRALIFCQLKAMLDILENDLFKTMMKSVSYMRLDGSVPHSLRHSLVTRFNNDPSIDVLLLTTQVGGLGLNLTGADTVIFVEHDWSPMKDLQAMDRAHRIGQKKVVNVYRLITRATLEEKIMGLQKFKLMTAATVISSENASLETMGTDKLLDLFALSGKPHNQSNWGVPQGQSPSTSPASSSSMKTILDTLPDLWDDKDYEEEYDLTNFVKTLK